MLPTRRDVFATLFGLAAPFTDDEAPAVKASAIGTKDGPFFVLQLSDNCQVPNQQDRDQMRAIWEQVFDSKPPGKLVIVGPGAELLQLGGDGCCRLRERYEEREFELVARNAEELMALHKYLMPENHAILLAKAAKATFRTTITRNEAGEIVAQGG